MSVDVLRAGSSVWAGAGRHAHRLTKADRRFAAACAAALVFTGVFATWVGGTLGGRHLTDVVDDSATAAAALVAAVAGLVAAARSHGRGRAAWLLVGLACACWSFGELAWGWIEVVQGLQVPTPSIADAGYLGAVPLALAGLLLMPGGAGARRVSWWRTGADAAITAGALLFLSWATVLQPVVSASADTALGKAVTVAYPVSDIAVLTVALLTLARAGRGGHLVLALLCAGFCASTVADSTYTYLSLSGTYSTGGLIDTAWVAGYLFIALAALRPCPSASATRQRSRPSRLRGVMPYLALAAMLPVAAAKNVVDGSLTPLLFWDLYGVIAVVLIRQVLVILDNARLTRDLEARAEEVRRSEERFRSLVQNSSDAITIVDASTSVLYQSPSVRQVFGYSPDQWAASPVIDLVHPDDRATVLEVLGDAVLRPGRLNAVECRIQHRDGRWCEAEVRITNLLDEPSVCGLVLNTRDIGERKALQERLADQAMHDPLTGLANRTLFRDRLTSAVTRAHGRPVSVLFLDLDSFKQVNDTLGHGPGDALLIAVAQRLTASVRPGDLVARLGGDEFAVLLDGADEDGATRVGRRIEAALVDPVDVAGRPVRAAASVGIATRRADESAEDLLRNADVAMYSAKARGKGRVAVFEPRMHASIVERVETEAALREAVECGGFTVHYQPVMEVATGRVVAVEALARWEHPRRGLVPPAEFIRLAEDTGLITEIDRVVLATAAREVRGWQLRHGLHDPVGLSVNVSARHLTDSSLLETVAATLADSGLPAESLTLEITESLLMDNLDAAVVALRALRRLGVHVAIDDFGTGYSSLAQLRMLDVDVLKMDRSFVENVGRDGRDDALARAIVGIGSTLGLTVVAEGVDSAHQLAALAAMGCTLAQGFHLARPADAATTEAVLVRTTPVPRSA